MVQFFTHFSSLDTVPALCKGSTEALPGLKSSLLQICGLWLIANCHGFVMPSL